MLIDLADLPSLVAIGLQHDPAGMMLWHPTPGMEPTDRRRAAVVAEKARAYGLPEPIVADFPHLDQLLEGPQQGMAEAMLLLEAMIAAREHGCTRLIWPRQVGPDESLLGPVVERADLLCALVETDSAIEAPAIDLPVADLDDRQIVDLANDTGVPMRAFWPCLAGEPEPCEACAGCLRWLEAFNTSNIPWPWSAAALPVR